MRFPGPYARFKKGPVTGLGETLVRFRNHTYRVVRDRWPAGAIAVSLNLFLTFVLLLVSLRFVGMSSDELEAPSACSPALAFLAGTILPTLEAGWALLTWS